MSPSFDRHVDVFWKVLEGALVRTELPTPEAAAIEPAHRGEGVSLSRRTHRRGGRRSASGGAPRGSASTQREWRSSHGRHRCDDQVQVHLIEDLVDVPSGVLGASSTRERLPTTLPCVFGLLHVS